MFTSKCYNQVNFDRMGCYSHLSSSVYCNRNVCQGKRCQPIGYSKCSTGLCIKFCKSAFHSITVGSRKAHLCRRTMAKAQKRRRHELLERNGKFDVEDNKIHKCVGQQVGGPLVVRAFVFRFRYKNWFVRVQVKHMLFFKKNGGSQCELHMTYDI